MDHDGERILTFMEHLPAWYLDLYTLDFIRFSQQPNEIDTLFNILQIRTLFSERLRNWFKATQLVSDKAEI